MEEIRINHPFWKTLLLAIGCLEIFALFIRLNGGLHLSEYGFLELLFFFGFGVVGLYFLLVLLKERLLGQPFIAISNDSLVVSRLLRKKKVINFSDVKSFDSGNTILGSTIIYIHFRQGMDRVKDSINISFIDANDSILWHLLERIKIMSRHSPQSTIQSQREKLEKLYKVLDSNNYDPTTIVLFVFLFYYAIFAFTLPNTFNRFVHEVNITEFLIVNVLLLLFVFLFIKIIIHVLRGYCPCIVPTRTNQKQRNVPIGSSRLNSSSSSSCLNVLLIALILLCTPIFLYVGFEDSIRPYFYYHTSSNGIRYGIPKLGRKGAIVTGITEGTYAIDIPEFVTYKDAKYPVTTIDKKAFNSCTSLTSVIVGDSIRNISCDFLGNSFSYCPNLRYLKVTSGNTVYYSPDRCDAIIHNKKLIVGCENTVIPEDVIAIGDFAFSGRVNMTSITIPSSVKIIGISAFNLCTSLTSIVIPDGVTCIYDHAFYRCKNLTSVVIPESVTSIYYMAFFECNSLTDVYCYAKKPPRFETGRNHDEYPFDETFIKEHTTLHVPAGSIERYKREAPWRYFKSIVGVEWENKGMK